MKLLTLLTPSPGQVTRTTPDRDGTVNKDHRIFRKKKKTLKKFEEVLLELEEPTFLYFISMVLIMVKINSYGIDTHRLSIKTGI